MTAAVELPRREVLDTARHEAGHLLAAWWNGQMPYAVEMRHHDERAARLDRRGREIGAEARAYVEAPKFIAAPALYAQVPEALEYLSAEDLRDMVGRDLLYTLAGPAVEWRGERDPEALTPDPDSLWTEAPACCWDDLANAGELLALIPEAEREEFATRAARRAAALVCRYWPELCALADRVAAAERLEDEALAAVLSETLGTMPTWRAQPLASLDHAARLGDAELVAWWEREHVDGWRLAATVDGVPLAPGITVEHLPPEELAALSCEDLAQPSGWYFLSDDALSAEPLPARGTLRRFLAGLVADKLEEVRRDPDTLSTPESMEAAQ